MTILSTSGQSLADILDGAIPDKFAPKQSSLPEKHMTVLVKGLAPGLICHNGRLADESDEITQRVAQLVKRAKTASSEEVTRQLNEARMLGGLYLNKHGQPVVPQHMIAAALAKGASRVDKMKGKTWISGVNVRSSARIIHNGPEDLKELCADPAHQFIVGVKIGKATVMGCRPHFTEWAAELPISFETDLVDADTVTDIVSCCWSDIIGVR